MARGKQVLCILEYIFLDSTFPNLMLYMPFSNLICLCLSKFVYNLTAYSQKTKYKILSHSTNNFTQFDLECYGQTRVVFVMLRLVFVKLRKLKNLMNGGSLVSSEINTLNLNLSLRLNLRLNLKLNLNVSLKLNLNLKLNLGLKFGTEFFFFYLGFLSRTFTIDRVVDKRENYFFNSFLQRPTVSQTLRH